MPAANQMYFSGFVSYKEASGQHYRKSDDLYEKTGKIVNDR